MSLDDYDIGETIHEGASGNIVVAVHRASGESRILKMALLGTEPSLIEALVQEGEVQSTIHHRNVVRVLEMFTHEGLPVLVMNHVQGHSLADHLENAPRHLDLGVVLRICHGIANGLAACHAVGVVHRNLKPENVLLARVEGTLRTLLSDFGMAKVLEVDQPPEAKGISKSFWFIGTPEYMAPEQARDPGKVDTRADLFSLGAIMYELLSGHVCFDAPTDIDILVRSATGDFTPLSELREGLPAALVTLTHSLLNADPAKRPASALDVLAVLETMSRAR